MSTCTYFTLAETVRKVKSLRKKREIARGRLFYLPRPEVDSSPPLTSKVVQLVKPDPDID